MAYILVDFRRYHDILDRIPKMPSPEVVAFNIGAWCFLVLFILWTLCMMQDFCWHSWPIPELLIQHGTALYNPAFASIAEATFSDTISGPKWTQRSFQFMPSTITTAIS